MFSERMKKGDLKNIFVVTTWFWLDPYTFTCICMGIKDAYNIIFRKTYVRYVVSVLSKVVKHLKCYSLTGDIMSLSLISTVKSNSMKLAFFRATDKR